MKKIIEELLQSNFSTYFPEEIADELNPKLADKEYKASQFFEEYGSFITMMHENEVRLKLRKLNNKLGFFVVLTIISLIVTFIVIFILANNLNDIIAIP